MVQEEAGLESSQFAPNLGLMMVLRDGMSWKYLSLSALGIYCLGDFIHNMSKKYHHTKFSHYCPKRCVYNSLVYWFFPANKGLGSFHHVPSTFVVASNGLSSRYDAI